MPRQRDLAEEAELQQSRISMFETPGMANMTLETLAKVAAGLRSGVIVKFVPFSEMLAWENNFSPGRFDVVRLNDDVAFINPEPEAPALISGVGACIGRRISVTSTLGAASSQMNDTALGTIPSHLPPTGEQHMEMPHAG